MTEESAAGQLSWLLDNLVTKVEHVRQAVLLSQDGLVVATSRSMSREDGDHLSALAAGVQSLARGAGRHFEGGDVRQTVIEMESAFLFIMAAGQGTCLAVVSSAEANIGDGHAGAPDGQAPHGSAEIRRSRTCGRVNGHDCPEGPVA